VLLPHPWRLRCLRRAAPAAGTGVLAVRPPGRPTLRGGRGDGVLARGRRHRSARAAASERDRGSRAGLPPHGDHRDQAPRGGGPRRALPRSHRLPLLPDQHHGAGLCPARRLAGAAGRRGRRTARPPVRGGSGRPGSGLRDPRTPGRRPRRVTDAPAHRPHRSLPGPAPPPHRSPTRRAPRMTSPLTDSSTPTAPAGPTDAPGGHPSGASPSEQAAASPASHDAAAPTLRDAFRQPKSVWAIAFAATVSFMGIGLVDPILPAISSQLDATPSQAMLLFTSYLFITALAMFFTSWFASKAGVKRTLLIGLLLVVLFAALAAGAGSVEEIIGLRAGWGLGNALFISTALAAIVGATTGPSAGAIILYETALGIGLAVGPLLGGLLGAVSWRAPFAGTAVLMGVGFLAIVVLLRPEAKPAHVSPLAALRALS